MIFDGSTLHLGSSLERFCCWHCGARLISFRSSPSKNHLTARKPSSSSVSSIPKLEWQIWQRRLIQGFLRKFKADEEIIR